MAFTNNVMTIRYKLLAKLVDPRKKDKLANETNRLPIELSPRRSHSLGRCCIRKEYAMCKYKLFPLLGFDMTDEIDELAPLSEYARHTLERKNEQKENIFRVIDETCSPCVQVNYEIANLCRGCAAYSCHMDYPKDAIRFQKNGQTKINHDVYISCGRYHQSCPYRTIVFILVPYEETCPVKAISKDENGIKHINENKCIYYGKYLNACPFGAIFKISQVFGMLKGIRRGGKTVAILAPSILGQFNISIEAAYGAPRQMGLAGVVEVAQGVMDTVSHETAELKEKLEGEQLFTTASYYPSYIELVNKHMPGMKPYVSSTGSSMYYIAHIAKERHPDAEIIFIGSCVAKRRETRRDECVDYILTFEEMASIFEGLDVQPGRTQSFSVLYTSVREAYGFAQAGDVMGVIQAYLGEETKRFSATQISDLNKKNIGSLCITAKTGKVQG